MEISVNVIQKELVKPTLSKHKLYGIQGTNKLFMFMHDAVTLLCLETGTLPRYATSEEKEKMSEVLVGSSVLFKQGV